MGNTGNKFEILDKINDSSEKICLKRASIVSSVTSIKSKKNVQIKNHQSSQKKRRNTNHGKSRQRIVLLGDSHARKCASELHHNLGKDYEVTSFVKPGVGMEEILGSSSESVKSLSKNDVLIV